MSPRCACGDDADRSNVDLNVFQCETCWDAWSRWADANRDRHYTDWPGRA